MVGGMDPVTLTQVNFSPAGEITGLYSDSIFSSTQITTGGSGDLVYQIRRESGLEGPETGILKVFRSSTEEIDLHLELYQIFGSRAKPFPIIYRFGTISQLKVRDTTLQNKKFLLMELIDPFQTLEEFLTTLDRLTNATTVLQDIVVQLFLLIMSLKINGYSHCDLHPGNIVIVTKGEAHIAKLIDFGLSKINFNPCSKTRRTTRVLEQTRLRSSGTYSAREGTRSSPTLSGAKVSPLRSIMGLSINVMATGDSDINMLIELFRIINLIDHKVFSDFNHLYTQMKRLSIDVKTLFNTDPKLVRIPMELFFGDLKAHLAIPPF
jgi:serine/threonine protein kinase